MNRYINWHSNFAECADYPGQRLWRWTPDARYTSGDLAVYGDFVYRAVHANSNCQPAVNILLWECLGRV